MPDDRSHDVPSAFFPSFDVLAPRAQSAPFVFSSPHSGRLYPPEFLAISRLDPKTLRRSEDCFVDRLFRPVASLGAPLISARFPRAYLDLNREPFELDPELVGEPLPAHANTQSIRVAGGLGTVARIVADGEEIYPARLSLASVLARSSSKEWLGFAVKVLPMRAMTTEERKRLVDEVIFTSPKTALEFVSENRQHLDPADVNAVTSDYVNTIGRDMCLHLTHRNTIRQTDYFSDAQIAIFAQCAQAR